MTLKAREHTRLLTMILLSTAPDAAPAGVPLVAGFVALVVFLTPPTGAFAGAAALPVAPTRRVRGRRVVCRRSLRISSRD